MNRQQRRKLHITKEQCEMYDKITDIAKLRKAIDGWKPIPEGAKVKLNFSKISSQPNWNPNTDDFNHENYTRWVRDNVNKIFTVEYDAKHKVNPTQVCLKEDKTDPKWLFWEGDLIVIDGKEI